MDMFDYLHVILSDELEDAQLTLFDLGFQLAQTCLQVALLSKANILSLILR